MVRFVGILFVANHLKSRTILSDWGSGIFRLGAKRGWGKLEMVLRKRPFYSSVELFLGNPPC